LNARTRGEELQVPDTTAPGQGQPVSADRLGRILRLMRWPTLILWVLAIVLLHPLAGSLPSVTNGTSAAYGSPSAPSTRVALLQQAADRRAGQPVSNQAVAVFVRPGGLTTADSAAVAAARTAVGRLLGTLSGLVPATFLSIKEAIWWPLGLSRFRSARSRDDTAFPGDVHEGRLR
jgi:hypothetical protein